MKQKAIGAVLLAFPLTLAGAGSLHANAYSASPYWEGTDASGVIVAGGQCPVEVEREILTLDIPHLPALDADEYSDYAAKAEARYTFYNPTDLDVSMKLLFPCGNTPSYEVYGGEDENLYTVTVNGERVLCAVRHTYQSGYFDIERDLKLVEDGETQDAFYSPGLTVTAWSYRLYVPDGEGKTFTLTFDCNPQKTRVFASGARLGITNGFGKVSFTLDGDENTVTVYTAGEPLRAVATKIEEDVAGTVRIDIEEETFSFREFALRDRPAESEVTETDWYNAFVGMLADNTRNGYTVYDFRLKESMLTGWYEYTIEIPAGGRAENCVTAPVYPNIDGKINPRYEYTYLLSPAQKWADFKRIEITVNTPYYLSGSTLDFTRSQDGTGYTFTRDSLPLGELTFVLTEKENLATQFNPFDKGFFKPTITAAFVILLTITGIAVLVTVLVVVFTRKGNAAAAPSGKKKRPPADKNDEKKE